MKLLVTELARTLVGIGHAVDVTALTSSKSTVHEGNTLMLPETRNVDVARRTTHEDCPLTVLDTVVVDLARLLRTTTALLGTKALHMALLDTP